MSGDWVLATGETGTMNLDYNSDYDVDTSLTLLTGNWQEAFGVMAFDPDGSFFEQDIDGCVLSGQASVIDSTYNAYDIVMEISLCDPESNGNWSGVAFSDGVDTDVLILFLNKGELFFLEFLDRL
jgi:hypothetical protein